MIKHVVMWRLKELAEGNNKTKNIELVKNKLLQLKPIIAEIESLEVGENYNFSDDAFELVLITTHHDKNALSRYINHPEHKEAAAFIANVVKERVVVDFEN